MTELTYDAAPMPIRGDLSAAHWRAWRHISMPGTWFTGAIRIAIAAETRNARRCPFCRARKQALSPYAVEGKHDALGTLPQVMVELVHRTATDASRLKRDWYASMLDAGISEEEFVETVSVICTTIAIDTFTRAIGMAPPPFPEPIAGEPSRVRPAEAKQGAAWVPWIAPEDAAGFNDEIFAASASNVQRSLSLVPEECRAFFDLVEAQYLARHQMRDFDNEFRTITRSQMELVAGRVSAINQCAY
jgi:alkylhydroperoxidase family enzyme